MLYLFLVYFVIYFNVCCDVITGMYINLIILSAVLKNRKYIKWTYKKSSSMRLL